MSLRRSLILLVFLATPRGPTRADDGWATYRSATAAAESKAWATALPLYRQALNEATEPALRQATCFGLGVTARALVEASAPDGQALACEGEGAFGCFLGLAPAEPDALAVAEAGRAALAARCRPAPPPPPPDTTLSWVLVGTSGAAWVGGGVLLALAFSDAAEVRDRGRVGTADLEDRARLELGLGYGLLGGGAVLAGIALWVWPTEAEVSVRPGLGGLSLEGRF